jgi:hypothetical protein
VCNQLAVYALPLGLTILFTYSKCAYAIMLEIPGSFISHPKQHINKITNTESLTGAVYTGDGFLRRYRTVEYFLKVYTCVTIPTGFAIIAKVLKQYLSAAAGGFT